MDLDEFIEHCDGLKFLRQVRLKYYYTDGAAIPESVVYQVVTDPAFNIIYNRGLGPQFGINKDRSGQYLSFDLNLSFEKFFEELSIEGKENILFHLDLFTRMS